MKDKLSFNDVTFRLPGLALILIGFWGEFSLAKNGVSPITFTIGDKIIPAYFALGCVGVLIVMAPYVELGISKWRKRGQK